MTIFDYCVVAAIVLAVALLMRQRVEHRYIYSRPPDWWSQSMKKHLREIQLLSAACRRKNRKIQRLTAAKPASPRPAHPVRDARGTP